MNKPFEEGQDYPVWWNTERPKCRGYYPARILEVLPYDGRYKQWFTHILRLHNPRSKRGWTDMAVDINNWYPQSIRETMESERTSR